MDMAWKALPLVSRETYCLLYKGLASDPQADLARETRVYTSLEHLGGA